MKWVCRIQTPYLSKHCIIPKVTLTPKKKLPKVKFFFFFIPETNDAPKVTALWKSHQKRAELSVLKRNVDGTWRVTWSEISYRA